MNEESSGTWEQKNLGGWENIKVPGIHPSMSMNDLVSHIENRFTEHRSSNNPLSNEEREGLEILDEISKCLFTDSQHAPTSDEKSIMTRVNSLYSLLQKDNGAVQNFNFRSGYSNDMVTMNNKKRHELDCSAPEIRNEVAEDSAIHGKSADVSDEKHEPGMSRKDSVGELLLNLPRIASLPQFFFNITEDFNNEAR